MKRTAPFIATWLIASMLILGGVSGLQAEEVFVTIGGGDFTGVYFPTGVAIAKMFNHARLTHGIRATVEATTGSPFNLNAIMAGYMDFGLAQADDQHHAFKGLAEWREKGPQKELRSVFSIYHESLTLVAAMDAGITSIQDLKGKRVSLGDPRPTVDRIVMDALAAAGLDPERDIIQHNVIPSEAPFLLRDNRIDAYFFPVGHPSETIRIALASPRKTRIIPIAGPAVDRLVADNSYYVKETIKLQRLYPDLGKDVGDVETFGVMATFCTSANVPDEVVYAVTKAVFENLDDIRRQLPALADLKKESMLKGLSAPVHPGAQKYFREAGLTK